MRAGRPIFLDLLKIHLPIGAWVSILHRVSGILLALSVPALLYAFMLSLRSEADFARLTGILAGGLGHLLLLIGIWAALHHLFAGLRHLGLDLGWGEQRERARQTAWVCMILGVSLGGAIALLL